MNETSLDAAIQLFQRAETYEEYKDGLGRLLTGVHTQEELDKASEVVKEKKRFMLDNNPDFRATMSREKAYSKIKVDHERAKIKAEKSGSVVYPQTFEEAKEKAEEVLVCPICGASDKGNIMNNELACMKCMHRLVPESELKDYNREYRRNWRK